LESFFFKLTALYALHYYDFSSPTQPQRACNSMKMLTIGSA